MSPSNRIPTIEELTGRYEKLKDEKIAAETRCESALKQLESIQQEAEEKYGTSDLKKLQKLLDQMEAENLKMQKEYEQHLNQVESELAKVDQTHEQQR